MQRLELVKFLADSASEILGSEMLSDSGNTDRLDEAAELLNLSSRILSRSDLMVGKDLIQEAA
ncbi:MAG: hypothetical protein WD075_08145 [Rhodospirillales bacterium]